MSLLNNKIAALRKNDISISEDAITNISLFKTSDNLPFGKVLLPIMIQSIYEDGEWGKLKIRTYQNLTFDPTCKVFHYGQEIFEGMKAYNYDGAGPFLFRPEENAKRFAESADRMAIPPLPNKLYLDSIKAISLLGHDFIPKNSGESLYIRPFIFATDNHLGIKPSESFLYLVIASPSGAYFSSGSVKVLIERYQARACAGGVGNAKTGGNYASSLQAMVKAKKQGFDQVLWLDSSEKKYVEELSGMNFFAVYDDQIITPEINDSILNGITRKSVIEIAKTNNLKITEKKIEISTLLDDIKSTKCSEVFACGTAVIITPISELGDSDGQIYHLKYPQGNLSLKLREKLLDLQEGRSENYNNWRVKVDLNL